MINSKNLKEAFSRQLYTNFIFQDLESTDYIAISTPFVDKNFDNITLYARELEDGEIEISDFGNTLINGDEADFDNQISPTLKSFGVALDGENLLVKTDIKQIQLAIWHMLQAILQVTVK